MKSYEALIFKQTIVLFLFIFFKESTRFTELNEWHSGPDDKY